jgi:hypothetical protein
VAWWIAEGSDEPEPEFSLMRDAIHEGGHTLTYAGFGFRPTFVRVDPDKGGGEMCPEPSSPWRLPTTKQRLLVAQAGSAAECIWDGDDDLGWTTSGIKDQIELQDLLAELGSDLDPNDFTEIDALLRQPDTWSRIVRLAEALVEQHYIDNLDPYLVADI